MDHRHEALEELIHLTMVKQRKRRQYIAGAQQIYSSVSFWNKLSPESAFKQCVLLPLHSHLSQDQNEYLGSPEVCEDCWAELCRLPHALGILPAQPSGSWSPAHPLPARTQVAASVGGKGPLLPFYAKIYFPFSWLLIALFCLLRSPPFPRKKGENDQVAGELDFYFRHVKCYFISQ